MVANDQQLELYSVRVVSDFAADVMPMEDGQNLSHT